MAKFFSKFEFLNFTLPTPRLWMVILFYAFIYFEYDNHSRKNENYLLKISNSKINLLKDKIRNLLYYTAFVVIIFLVFFKVFPKHYIEFTAIDVGQGDSFLFVTERNKRILDC